MAGRLNQKVAPGHNLVAANTALKARTWGLHFTVDVINHLTGKKLEQVGFVRVSIGDWHQKMTFYGDSEGVAGEFDPGDKIVAKSWKPWVRC